MITISVIVYQELAYTPTTAQMESGPYLATEPVIVAPLTIEAIAQALQTAYGRGNPTIPDVAYAEYKQSDPILKATGAKSWKQIARKGASYGINLDGNEVVVYCSKLDEKGRFVHDPTKTKRLKYPADFPEIATIIVEDTISLRSK